MYFEVHHVPNEVTVEEMDTYLSSKLLCKVVGIGFDPVIARTGKKFYFHQPEQMLEYDIINKLKGKCMKGHTLRIYKCKDKSRVEMLRNKKIVWVNNEPETVSNNNDQTKTNKTTFKACKALFAELFDRYPGLDDINAKSNNLLGYEIFGEIKKRVIKVLEGVTEAVDYSGLTEKYRSVHPHESDLALLQLCHGRFDDTPLPPENDLAIDVLALEHSSPFPFVPEKKIRWATTFYGAHITRQLNQHIQSLDDKCVGKNSTEEEKATALVRKHLKASTGKMNYTVRAWMSTFLKSTQQAVVRVYGIPRLPNFENLMTLLKARGCTTQLTNSGVGIFPYNCAVLTAHRHKLDELLMLTGNSLDDCTLLVRLHILSRAKRQARHIRAVAELQRAAAETPDGDEWQDL